MNVTKWPLWLGYRDSQLVRQAFAFFTKTLNLGSAAARLKLHFVERINGDTNIAGQFNSKTWDLKLARSALAPLLSVLAHELIHVAQQPVTVDLPFGRVFRGEFYSGRELADMMSSNGGYVNMPWETEAYTFQMALYGMFLDQLSPEDRAYIEATEDRDFAQLLVSCSGAAALWKKQKTEGATTWPRSS